MVQGLSCLPLAFLALAATSAAEDASKPAAKLNPSAFSMDFSRGKDGSKHQRRKLDHDSGSGDQGSGSGDQGSGDDCNPCGCKNIPGNYWQAGWTSGDYIFPIPPSDGVYWLAKFNASDGAAGEHAVADTLTHR